MSGNLALLLDTHILAWIASGDRRLSATIMARLEREVLFVSAVVAFEYEDLRRRGRFEDDVALSALQAEIDFGLLDFDASLAAKAAELPRIHRDPVDRMLVAHAIAADMPLVTADQHIRRYPLATVW